MSSVNEPKPAIVRPAQLADRQALHALVRAAAVFSPAEIDCACEMIDSALDDAGPDGYWALVAIHPTSSDVMAYVLYGRTLFTRAACDLYWLAAHPQHRRGGAARALVAAMEADLQMRGIEHIRVETSGTEGYSAARAFYARCGYDNIACIPDFYKPGDALYQYYKRLAVVAAAT